MPPLQYLICCDDGSMCIVHRTSINCGERAKLTEGRKVSFMWPENESSPHRKEYVGEIIQSSTRETILQIVKQRKIREFEAETKRKDRLEKEAKAKLRKEKDNERKEVDDKKNDHKSNEGEKKTRNETAEMKKHHNNDNASCSRKRKNSLKSLSPVSDVKRKCNVDMAKSLFKELDMIDNEENVDETSETQIQDEQDVQKKTQDVFTGLSMGKNNSLTRHTEKVEVVALHEKKNSVPTEKLAIGVAGVRNQKSTVDHLKDLRTTLSKALDLVDTMLSQNAFDDEGSAAGSSHRMIDYHVPEDGIISDNEIHSRTPSAKSVTSYSELPEQEDNSWTLRFTKEEENKVIEIMPATGIYVAKAELSNINRNAKGQTQMARQLLDAIFTREALRTCSLCGKKPKGLGKGQNLIRPALHQEARVVLLEYVQQTADKLKWPTIADQLIIQSLRGKLNEMKDTGKLNKM